MSNSASSQVTPFSRGTGDSAGKRRRAPWLAARKVLVIFAGLGMTGAGCFIEIAEAPGFRYSCSADKDCESAEACIDGLCQVPCTSLTFDEACPEDGSYLMCFNGVCASACQVGADACSSPNSCVGLDPSGESPIGVCGAACDAMDPSTCPMGEICLAGTCFATCDVDDPESCGSSGSCVEGICIPSTGGGGF